MKLLLTTLNSKYVHSNLALRYLYGAAGEMRKFLEVREFTINNDDDYIFTELVRGGHEAVFFSCYLWNIERILYLAENLKKVKPKVFIALGGPEVSHRAKSLLDNRKYIDFILLGEGEPVMQPLLSSLSRLLSAEQAQDRAAASSERFALSKLPGLAGRRGREVFLNRPEELRDFGAIPFPYALLPWKRDQVAYYETARGCPFSCAYCLSSLDKKVRARPMDKVKEELRWFLRQEVKQVKLVDRTFNFDQDRCREILSFLMEEDNGVTNFHMEMVGELLDEPLLSLLEGARPGLFRFEIGVQSTNEKALAACNRKGDFSVLAEKVERLTAMGNIPLHLDLIAGLPFEDYNSFKRSFNDVYALAPGELQLGFLKLLPGAPLREKAADYGYVYRKRAPYEVLESAFLSAEGLCRLKTVETVLDLYYNRGGFTKTLAYCTTQLRETAFDFYEELADFYYLKGFQHRSHKKEDLYRILHLYGTWKDRSLPGAAANMKELLSADLAETLNPEAVKRFYKQGFELKV